MPNNSDNMHASTLIELENNFIFHKPETSKVLFRRDVKTLIPRLKNVKNTFVYIKNKRVE